MLYTNINVILVPSLKIILIRFSAQLPIRSLLMYLCIINTYIMLKNKKKQIFIKCNAYYRCAQNITQV